MTRRTLVALALFFGLVAAALYVRTIPQKGDRTGDRPGAFAPIPAEEIHEVAIKGEKGEVVLRRVDEESFRVVKPVDYPADSYAAKTLVEKLSKVLFGDVVTDRPEKHAEFEVDEAKGTRVTVKDEAQKTRADFWVGKFMSGATMMRPVGKNQVFQAIGSLKHVFAKDLAGWRDKKILEFEREEAKRLEVKTEAGAITLTKEDDQPWKVESSPVPIADLDEAMPRQIVSSMATLRANGFHDDRDAATGLDQPRAEIEVTLDDDRTHTLLIGAEKGDQYYARPLDGKQVFLLSKHMTERLARRPIEFRNKTILSFKADDALEIRISKGKKAITLVKNGANWAARPAADLDPTKVRNLISTLSNLRASTLSGDAIAGKPTGEVRVRLKDNTRATLRVGPLVNDANYYVERDGRDDAFLVSKFVVDRFLIDAAGLEPSK